jgi:hypothetical protein
VLLVVVLAVCAMAAPAPKRPAKTNEANFQE